MNYNNRKILIEGLFGYDLLGEIFWITKYIADNYPKSEITIISENKIKLQKKFNKYNINYKKIKIINKNKKRYAKALKNADILINDGTFPEWFIKKNKQIYINVWHGTPYKTMGKEEKNKKFTYIANTQRNFLIADLLIFQNKYSEKTFINDYYLKNLINQKILVSSYFKTNLLVTKKEEKINKKKRIVFLPTWKGKNFKNSLNNNDEFLRLERELEKQLKHNNFNNYEFYYKNHYSKKTNIKTKHLKSIPEEFELYDFLATCDILISDFSSIIFDFLASEKQIILNFEDREKYLKMRDIYEEADEDFKNLNIAYSFKETIEIILNDKLNKINYQELNQKYHPKLNEKITWIDDILDNKLNKLIRPITVKNYLIFPGGMKKNGITVSFLNTIENIKHNLPTLNLTIWVSKFYFRQLENDLILKKCIENSNINIIISKDKLFTSKKANKFWKYRNYQIVNESKLLKKAFENESKRIFGTNQLFNTVINFSGFESYINRILLATPAKNRVIFLHNNMLKEIKNRKNLNEQVFKNNYKNFNKLVFVSDFLKQELINSNLFFKKMEDKTFSVWNPIFFLSEKKYDQMSFNLLKNNNNFNLIHIGREAKVKRHDLAIDIFEKVSENNKTTTKINLIFLTEKALNTIENKNYWKTIIDKIEKSKFKNNIYHYQSVNSEAFLEQANVLLLSSDYEGLPMVILEAMSKNVYCIANDLPGIRELDNINQIGEVIDFNNQEKIVNLLNNFIEFGIPKIQNFDKDEYNKQALKMFLKIID